MTVATVSPALRIQLGCSLACPVTRALKVADDTQGVWNSEVVAAADGQIEAVQSFLQQPRSRSAKSNGSLLDV